MFSTDALRLLRHLADVAALRNDPVVQRQRLIDGLNALLGTTDGWLFAVDNFRPHLAMRYRAQVLTSDPDPLWLRYITEFGVRHPMTDDPYAWAVLNDPRRRQVWTYNDAVPDEATRQRFSATLESIDALQITDGIVGAVRIGPRGDDIIGFSLHCFHGAPTLGLRGRRLARLAVSEIARLAADGIFQFGPPSTALTDLPPRLQQTLLRVLDGRSPKQIAADLAISIHTVREHLQRLYLRYGVSTREELTAKFVNQ